MDIVKVFGANLRKYRTMLGMSQEDFAENVVCIVHILAQLNVIEEAFHSKIYSE